MRKLLAATTALVLVSGVAHSEIAISGDGYMGLQHKSTSAMDFDALHRFRVKFDGTGTTDGGLSFGAFARLNSNNGSQGVDLSGLSISGAFGTIAFGNNDAADLQAGGAGDVGFSGDQIQIDAIAHGSGRRGGTEADIRYDQTIGGVSLAASFGPDPAGDIEYALGMSFASNGITIGAGFDSDDGMTLGAGYALNEELSFNGFYAEQDDTDGMAGDLKYVLGATTLSVVFATNSDDEKGAGLGLDHSLGGGASLTAGFGQRDLMGGEESAAEVGLKFTF